MINFKEKVNFNFFKLFFKGSFMGFADMIPGISGSTIALILGIYDQVLNSFKNINFKTLLRLKFKEFIFSNEIKFLFNLFLGISFSFIFFSKILNFLLLNNFTRTLLFSFFLGLVSSSLIVLLKEIKFNIINFFLLLLGTLFSLSLLYFNKLCLDLSSNFYLKLAICGNLAIFAMLLPGISGSYLLLVLGVYPLAISAVANIFNYENLIILFFLLIGILVGFLIYPRFILFLLKKFHSQVLSFLFGLVVGSIYNLWPFWEYKNINFQNKSFLICDKLCFPKIISFEFMFSLLFLIFGFVIFYVIKQKSKKIEN